MRPPATRSGDGLARADDRDDTDPTVAAVDIAALLRNPATDEPCWSDMHAAGARRGSDRHVLAAIDLENE